MKKKRQRRKNSFRYIAGECWRFDWTEEEVQEFIVAYDYLRKAGLPNEDVIHDLGELFKRRLTEVAVLIMDLGERGYIGPKGKGKKKHIFTIADCEQVDNIVDNTSKGGATCRKH